MHIEGVLCFEPSKSKTMTFTPESVVVSDLNYDYLTEKKLLLTHNNQCVDVSFNSQHIMTLYYPSLMSVFENKSIFIESDLLSCSHR